MTFSPASMPGKTMPKKPRFSKSFVVAKKAVTSPTDCAHVIKGAVWCVECATLYRERSRELYARSLRESTEKPDVIRAAHSRLKKSLKEYSLTSAGLEELQKEYVNLVASKSFKANDIYKLIATLTTEASNRNKEARENEKSRLAKETTLNSRRIKYSMPTRDNSGKIITSSIPYQLTIHAQDRMTLRGISEVAVRSTFYGNHVITPIGEGIWSVDGEDDVTLRGFFEKILDSEKFVIVTVFRSGQADASDNVTS